MICLTSSNAHIPFKKKKKTRQSHLIGMDFKTLYLLPLHIANVSFRRIYIYIYDKPPKAYVHNQLLEKDT